MSFIIIMLLAFHAGNLPSQLVPKSLKLGPEFSSDVSGDGPRREDRGSKSTDESPTSDSKSESSDSRPPTPPKPRGMGKRKYKNVVRKHRKKYPRRKPNDDSKCHHDDQNVRLKIQEKKQSETPTSITHSLTDNDSRPPTACGIVAEQKVEKIAQIVELQSTPVSSSHTHRSDALRIRRAKRRLQDPATKKKAEKARVQRRKVLGPLARKKDVELQAKKRAAAGPRDRREDVKLQAKKRAAAGPKARKQDVELQAKKREDFRKKRKFSEPGDRKLDIDSQAEKKKKAPGDRKDEYRRRTLARRKKRSKLLHEPFHC